MREEKRALFGKGSAVEEKVSKAVLERARDGKLPCALAFELAGMLSVEPMAVGHAADSVGVRIVECQLGLYGYAGKKLITPAVVVDGELEKAIRSRLEGGKLPCIRAWEIASRKDVTKMHVSSACEAMGVKISDCQLGAF